MEVVQADDSYDVTMADHPSWWGEGTECLMGKKEQDWCFVNQSKNGVMPVPAIGDEERGDFPHFERFTYM